MTFVTFASAVKKIQRVGRASISLNDCVAIMSQEVLNTSYGSENRISDSTPVIIRRCPVCENVEAVGGGVKIPLSLQETEKALCDCAEKTGGAEMSSVNMEGEEKTHVHHIKRLAAHTFTTNFN